MSVALSDVTSPPFDQEFDHLFREHHRLVYRTAYGVTGSPQPVSHAPETVLLLPKAYKRRWHWAVVAAAIVVAVLIPTCKKLNDQRAQLQARTQEDVLLMQAIEADRSRIVPLSMERIMALLPQDEATVFRRSQ